MSFFLLIWASESIWFHNMSWSMKVKFEATRVDKNFQKLCKKCAEMRSTFTKFSAKTIHNIALICAEKCWNFVRNALWNPLKFQKVQLFSFAPWFEPRSLRLFYQLIHCAIENWNASHLIWIYNNKTFDMKSAEIM